jgi:hypothetical protein
MAVQVQSNVLIAACVTGDFAPLQSLAAVVNRYDEKGNSLLGRFVATEPFTDNHAATLPRLITELRADVDLRHSRTGKTALHAAAAFGNLVAVRILIDHGATVDARDNSQSTPLICCASFAGNSRVVAYLLLRGASIDAVTSRAFFGSTALHGAVNEDQVDNARVLLRHGANRQIRDTNGMEPLEWAKSQAMRDLFQRTIEEVRLEIERQSIDRIGILLARANPLEEAMRGSDLVEGRLLINHPQFTPNHLEEGFRFAFADSLVRNYDFIFDLFAERAALTSLVGIILQGKLTGLSNTQRVLEGALRERDRLSQPDRRNADDFDVGRGDAGDRSSAIMAYNKYLQFRDYNEAMRVRELENQDARIRSLSEDIERIERQIAVLRRFQNHFNPATVLETGIQALAIN